MRAQIPSKMLKPRSRSAVRLMLGKAYYTTCRYAKWYLDGNRYASHMVIKPLPYVVATHESPLYRDLKVVDMWLQHNKVINLQIAIKQLDGLVLKPGEVFSYWRLIGKPTRKKGYVEGMVLSHGHFKAGVGGGLCQLSNLIYWMTLHTPLTVVERYRHSYDVFPDANRSQPFGSGATCVYNYRDLQIRNDTDQTYQLMLSITERSLGGAWHSTQPLSSHYEIYEAEHQITHTVWGGYVRHNIIRRREWDMAGCIQNDVYICENHALMMYQPFLVAPENLGE